MGVLYYMKLNLKLDNNNDTYWSPIKCYSYNCFMNQITGGRGIGKTTGLLIQALRNCNKDEQFIYLRRYKPELKEFVDKKSLDKICDDIIYKGGENGYTFLYKDTILGYGIALATALKYKSADFSKVTMIIYDESILDRGSTYHYLKNEVVAFLEFVSTVVRTRTNVKVFILGNNADIFNPYNAYFNVPIYDNIYTRGKALYCELAKNSPKLLELEKKTGLYELIKGTAYGDYHYENKVLVTNNYEIATKPSSARILCRAIINGTTLNFYTYNDDKRELNIFVEFVGKVIEGDITFYLFDSGKVNYEYFGRFRNRYRAVFARLRCNHRMKFDSDKAGEVYKILVDRA